jgi:TonB family protein
MDALSRLAVVFLLNALWQIAMISGVAALADRWLQRAPARYRHVLWVVALAAAVALPAASTWRAAESGARQRAVLGAAVITSSQVVLATGDALQPRVRISHARVMLRRAMAGAHPRIPVPRPIGRVILAAYFAFFVLMLLRLGRAWLRTRQIRRDAAPLSAGLLTRESTEDAEDRKSIILCSARIAGPVTVGAFVPAIILPTRLFEPASKEDLIAALAHERAHVRRHDYLCNLVCELMWMPMAFHPLALAIKRRLSESRELACDELAARSLNPTSYARSLVRMAHQISEFARPAALRPDYTLGVFDADILEERVMRLMKPRASMRLAKCSLLGAALFIAASCVAAASFSMSAQSGQAGDSNQVNAKASASGGVGGGVVGGVVAGVPGGVTRAVAGGESGGVSGGTTGGVSGGGIGGETVAAGTLEDAGKRQDDKAQTSEAKTGSLGGIVVDSSGARISKAGVRLISRNTSFQQAVESDDTGSFNFDDVPAGRYSLEVTSPGMGGAARSFEFKADGEPPFFPFVLHPGDVTETAVVAAKATADQNKATAAGLRKIRVGGEVAAAKLIESTHVSPEYPQAAKDNGIEGLVVLQATLSADGTPTELKVVSSPDDSLSKAALDAVSQWRYQPTLLNGEPVGVVTTITVDFNLQH